jgi:signal-transduction protein with cAMP-binding, CBS, and nucleotidyltransferase domain
MITDRDVCMAALLLGSNLKDITVGEVMTSEVRTCRPNDNLVEAQAIMQEARVRRLPVVNESEQLVGVISLTDLACEAEKERGSISKAEIGKILATLSKPGDIDFEAVADEIDMVVGV